MNTKRIYRLYKGLGLQLRNKAPRRRVEAKLRDGQQAATSPNETWAMNAVHDQSATGTKLRVLTVVDAFSRFSPIIDPRFGCRAEDGVATLEQACAATGYPRAIRVDQGSGFISRDATCGPMPTTARWTSRGLTSPSQMPCSCERTVRSSRRSTAVSGPSA